MDNSSPAGPRRERATEKDVEVEAGKYRKSVMCVYPSVKYSTVNN